MNWTGYEEHKNRKKERKKKVYHIHVEKDRTE